ncbi:hypothetical protein A0H81_00734 [Grifola frondosa]|uniref:RNI-like protein n=1 Tax=Grifola frondosa TaxID=5627 RepID=A0A1C7MQI6_GRIFR|nr:hypothetical protein A0H81_00734 [Grifola frondosa]
MLSFYGEFFLSYRCPKTVEAIVKHCPDLEVINLNYTAVTPISLAPLLHNCKALQVLKVAGIPNWTDATFGKLWSALDVGEDFRLTNLLTLNLRQNALSDAVVNPVLSICPNLRRLDLSFTLVLHPALSLNDNTVLEKLSLTSTKVSGLTLLNIVSHLPNIKILAIGALGGGQGSSAAISNTSAMNMRDQTLRSLTDMLEKCASLERVSLVGNTMLGTTGRQNSAIEDFIRRAGRRCKVSVRDILLLIMSVTAGRFQNLNLAGISSLRSSDLQGLLAEDIHQGAPQIQYLNLNNTMVDDDAAPYIASCAGLFPIIDACTELEKLDLTSCRGVGVVDRRRFFEVHIALFVSP